ncbi:uncharacterized protein LOC135087664 [Ostrinia nubilalis]
MRVTDLSVTHSVYQKKFSEALASLCWDGRGTLWLGSGTGALRQWDMVAVVQRDELQAHQDSINSIYFDEPTNTLVTASSDKTVKVWKLEPNS